MTKLLRAGIARVFRNKALYICSAVVFYINCLNPALNMLSAPPGDRQGRLSEYLVAGFVILPILIPVFVCSLLGSEHNFGTIRNKFILGNSRFTVYFSGFLLSLTGVLTLLALIWAVSGAMIAVGVLSAEGMTSGTLLNLLAGSLLMSVAVTALDAAIALCIQSKSISSVAALIASFMILVMGISATQSLSEPEYIEQTALAENENGDYETIVLSDEKMKNPNYLEGSQRARMQFIYDACPATLVIGTDEKIPAKKAIFTYAEIILLTAAGIIIFRKRDLK